MTPLLFSLAMLGVFAGAIGYVGSIARDAEAIKRAEEAKRAKTSTPVSPYFSSPSQTPLSADAPKS